MRGDRLVTATGWLVQAARAANALAVAFLLAVVAASFAFAPQMSARFAAKYGAGADVAAMLDFLRAIALLSLPVGWAIERLLRALRAILDSVAAGAPFAPANGARLRTIGWMLLVLQLADLAAGAAALVAARLGLDFYSWTPSFTGWFAVLVAFVLVRVFAAGEALRDDLDGTV